MNIVERAYSALTFAASVALLPPFAIRAPHRLSERYGEWNLNGEVYWFHGASVGEINGLLPLVQQYRLLFPERNTLMTATTLFGLKRGEGATHHQRILPFDNRFWLNRALKQITPRLFVFGETELWPVLIATLSARRVPLYMVNARVSDYSYRSYRLIRPLVANLLGKLSYIFAADADSYNRLLELGALSQKIECVGNAKYDVTPQVKDGDEAASLRKRFCASDLPVVVLGSLRPGEERHWFSALAEAQRKRKLEFIIAPRHKEKLSYFEQYLRESHIAYELWSKVNGVRQPGTCLLLDTHGDLERCYSFADLAFVGGTMQDYGGHNILEPAAYRTPVAVGPYVANVKEIYRQMVQRNAINQVNTAEDVRHLLNQVALKHEELKQGGARGFEVWKAQQGATQKILTRLAGQLS